MKYTSYFSQTLKLNGSPHLSQDMFALYMNIVHLEGRIAQLNELISKVKQNDLKAVYKLNVDSIECKINRLTTMMEPEEFLNLLVKNSVT